jgi:basic membrane protein A and related proteins
VISNRDATNPVNSHWALEWGTYKLNADGSMLPLAVPCWHWGSFYEKVIHSIFSGAWNDVPASRAINYWWGMDSNVTDVQLSHSLPDGVHTLANILRNGIIRGSISPFGAHITDQNGVLRCEEGEELSTEEILNMDWLCDNVDGTIPQYDELIPQSKGLVQLLGLCRNTLRSMP